MSPFARLRAARARAVALSAAALALALPASLAAQTGTLLGEPADRAAAARPARLTEELLEPFRYRLIGPANMSGRVTAIAVPDEPGHKTMYVGYASGGVWKTTNAGVTWQPVFDDQGFASIGDVAVAPSDAKVVWVGTGERNSLRSNGWGDGVYKSVDGGRSWKHMGLEATRETGRIVVHPTNPDIVWVAALGHLWGPNPERGVYKTTDGGQSWEKVLFVDDTTGFVDLKMDPSNPDVLYAAGWHRLRWGGGRMQGAGRGSGIWKTTDGGRTWTRLTDPALGNGLPTEQLGRIGLGVSPDDPNVVYAVIQAAVGSFGPGLSTEGGLFRSEDAGASWTRVNDLSAVPDYYYNEVWVDPTDADRIWLAGTLLGYSEDGGRTIEERRMPNVHVDHHALWVDPADSEHLVLGNDGGIYISWDRGEKWWHHPLPTGQFYEVDIDSTKTPYHVCGGLQDNGTWCGPTQTREREGITDFDWYTVFGGDGFRHAVSPDSPSIRFGESQFGNIARLDVRDWELTRIQPHAEDAGAESGYEFRWDWNTPFMLSEHDPTVLYLGGNFLFRMPDRGRSWRILGPDMTRANRFSPEPDSGHTSYHSLHSIAESPLTPDVLWTGSNDGLLWVSSDRGATWRNVTDAVRAATPGSPPIGSPERCFVAEIEASHHDRETAYVAYDCHRRDDYRPYVFVTSDGGRSFRPIMDGLPEDAGSYVVRESPINPDLLFVGNERGVWVSGDRGASWARLKNNLPTVAVRDLDIYGSARELVVGTYGRSVYVLDIAPLEELTAATLAGRAHLFDVKPARRFNTRDTYASSGDHVFRAPNPTQGARITYWLAEDVGKDVTLAIRREGGDESIATLTGSGRPGIHTVTWDLRAREPRRRELGGPTSRDDLRAVPPGTYTVTLRVGEKTMTESFEVHEGWVDDVPGRVR